VRHELDRDVITIFPRCSRPLAHSLAGRALGEGRWALDVVDLRDYATDKHRSVDDVPFGGGPGMVMRADVIDAALAAKRGPPRDLPLRARPAADAGRVQALAPARASRCYAAASKASTSA